MTKRIVMGFVVGTLLATMLPGLATAKAKPKADCKNGGWMALVDESGVPFTSEKACKGFVKAGGIPVPPETIFAVAYSNLDGTPGFGSGDVLIAKWVDENQSGAPDAGDRIVMGAYPTTLAPSGPADFGTFATTSHIVDYLPFGEGGHGVESLDGSAGEATFYFRSLPQVDSYDEDGPGASGKGALVAIRDGLLSSSPANQVLTMLDAPSHPSQRLSLTENPDDGDSQLIDVDISY